MIRSMMRLCLASCFLAVFAGCGREAEESPCAGLVYSEGGLTREQFAPCAKAMVGKLDTILAQTAVVMDKNQPKRERMAARGTCLAEISSLARLMKQAGGGDKLFRMSWADTSLNRFNIDVETARSVYMQYCYYAQPEMPYNGMEQSHAAARSLAAELR